MGDRQISAQWTVAFAAWVIGLALIVVDMVFGNLDTDALGLWFAGIGATLTVRGSLGTLFKREVTAFDLGRMEERASELSHLPRR